MPGELNEPAGEDALRVRGVIACEQCDLLHDDVLLRPREQAHCRRCGASLAGGRSQRQGVCLALTFAGLVTFVIAQMNPIVGLQLQGQAQSSTLWHAVVTLYGDGAWVISVLVFLTTFVFPMVELLALCYLLLALRDGRITERFALAMRTMKAIEPWVMVEVFMLGVLVAVVKLSAMASVIPGPGLWSFGALMLLLAAASATLDHEPMWKAFEEEFS